MTKKKAIIYTIIFIVLITTVQVWKTTFLKNPAENFDDMCKNVLAPSCQVYINKVTQEKKYEETTTIQKERIRQNKLVLSLYRHKITNKCLLAMTAKEADNELALCAGKLTGKKDFILLKTSQVTIQDIVVDSLVVAQIQYKELNNPKAAIKTLKDVKKILNRNPYMPEREAIIDYLDKKIDEFRK